MIKAEKIGDIVLIHISSNIYAWCFIAGIALNLLFVYRQTRRYKMTSYQSIGVIAFEGIGMIVGAKLLACFQTGNYNIITAGFSSYGALIGAILMLALYCKLLKTPFSQLMCIAIIPMALTYSIGKLGCFSAGCCYGINYDGFLSVVYENSKAAPHGTELFPVQLAESVAFMIMFILFYLFYRTHEFTPKHICIYVAVLSVIKGALYYLRNESVGNPFGSHQIICITLFIISMSVYVYIISKERVKPRERI